jgi:hypothetical protein
MTRDEIITIICNSELKGINNNPHFGTIMEPQLLILLQDVMGSQRAGGGGHGGGGGGNGLTR